jgi:hypothetical protein
MLYLNSAHAFTTHIHDTPLLMNPVIKSGGAKAMVDHSSSMRDGNDGRGHVTELKLSFSALLAMSGWAGKASLGTIGGGTSLGDVAVEAAKDTTSGKIIFITDGDDTCSKVKFFEEAAPPPGSTNEEYEEYNDRKRAALLDFIEKTTQADVWLLGVGGEVAKLVAMAAKPGRRINVAHVQRGNTASEVTSVIKAMVNAPPRRPVAAAAAADPAAAAEEETPAMEVIRVGAPACTEHEATEAEVRSVERAALNIAIDGSVTVDELKARMETCEAMDLGAPTFDKKLARTAVLWFLHELAKGRDDGTSVGDLGLPGTLLGGMRSVFEDPGTKSNWGTYLNKYLNRLSGKQCEVLIRGAKLKGPITYELGDGLKHGPFKDVTPYRLNDKIETAVVVALLEETDWAPAQSALSRRTPGGSPGKKRLAEEAELPAGPAAAQEPAQEPAQEATAAAPEEPAAQA